MSDFWLFVGRVAAIVLLLMWVVPAVLIFLSPSGRVFEIRFPGWKSFRSKEKDGHNDLGA